MMKRWFAVVVVAALALTLADAGTSHAQRWGGYGSGFGSGYGASPYGLGLGTGYNVSGYLPNTFAYGNYASWPNTYGYTTQYGMSPYYGGSYAAYGTPAYTGGSYAAYGTPAYTGGAALYSPSSYATMPQNYVSFYPPNFPQGSPMVGATTSNDQALIEVRCPADAQISFDGEETRQRGSDRLFTSPSLEPGKRYHYDVKARWNQDGRTEEKTRTVHIEAGRRVTVDFLSAGSDRDRERTQDRDLDRDRERKQDRDLDRDRERKQDRNRDRNPDRNRDRNPDRNPER
jgi:uncharacterized protein (TIGR03000 family)